MLSEGTNGHSQKRRWGQVNIVGGGGGGDFKDGHAVLEHPQLRRHRFRAWTGRTLKAPRSNILGITTARAIRSGIPWLDGSAREQRAELVAVGNALVDASSMPRFLSTLPLRPIGPGAGGKVSKPGEFRGERGLQRGQNLGKLVPPS